MKFLTSLAALLFLAGAAHAQVKQSGRVTPGHLGSWTTDNVIQDAGTPSSPKVTGGLGVVSDNQDSICTQNALTNYSRLCLGVTSSAAYLSLGNFGGAPIPLNIVVNGTAYPFPQGSGSFLPLSGGTMAGQIGQNFLATWAGGTYPDGTNKVGIYAIQNVTGSGPTVGYHTADGFTVPNNLIQINDSIALQSTAQNAYGFAVNHNVGGGATSGSRSALSANLNIAGAVTYIASTAPFYVGAQINATAAANVGGTSGQSRGEFFGLGVVMYGQAGGTFVQGASVAEFDLSMGAATYQRSSAIKLINYNNSGVYATVTGADVAFQISSAGARGRWRDWGIYFGDPQGGNDLPMASTGTLIGSQFGTAAAGIDFSATTLTNFLLGPGGFYVTGAGRVGTTQINAIGANIVTLATTQGNPMLTVTGDANSVASRFILTTVSTGPVGIDVQGTPAVIQFGTANATGVVVGKTSGTLAFYGGTAIAIATPTGACAGNTGCQALRDAMVNLHLITGGGISN